MDKTMDEIMLSVVIPCYNEKNTIETVLDAVRNCGVKNTEIIVVDDCSQDGTRDLLQGALRSKIDKLIFHKYNHCHTKESNEWSKHTNIKCN